MPRSLPIILTPLLCTILLLFTVTGCKRLKTGALDYFANKYSCPEERVELHDRPDLKWGDLIVSKYENSAELPSKEVQEDPERFSKWKRDRENQIKETRSHLNNHLDVFEVKGCGHQVFLGCFHPSEWGHWNDSVVCSEFSN